MFKPFLPLISMLSLIDSQPYIATNPKEEKQLKQANILIHLVSEQQYSNGMETVRTPFPMRGMILDRRILIELRTGGYSTPSGNCTLYHRESAERAVSLVGWSLIELRIQYWPPSGNCTLNHRESSSLNLSMRPSLFFTAPVHSTIIPISFLHVMVHHVKLRISPS